MSINFVLLAISITFSTVLASSPFLLECRIPHNSSLNQSVNVESLTHEEIEQLELEGRCFLACVTEYYSTEVNLINHAESDNDESKKFFESYGKSSYFNHYPMPG